MTILKSAISLIIILIFFSGCQTVKDKTDAIVEKENEKLSKFLGKSASELQMELGKPDEDFKNEFCKLLEFCDDTKELGYKLMWQGEQELENLYKEVVKS